MINDTSSAGDFTLLLPKTSMRWSVRYNPRKAFKATHKQHELFERALALTRACNFIKYICKKCSSVSLYFQTLFDFSTFRS